MLKASKSAPKIAAVFACAAVVSLLAAPSCKQAEKSDPGGDSTTTTTITTNTGSVTSGGGGGGDSRIANTGIPQVGGISLEHVGTGSGSAAALQDGECDQSSLGVMGFALGGACITAPFVAKIMLGNRNGDFDGNGLMDCSDLAAAKAQGKEAGIMLHLLCDEVVLKNDNVVSLAFADKNAGMAVSFADFSDDVAAVGAWTHGDAGSYPADIRLFQGASIATLKGHVALGLYDVNNGTVFLNGFGPDKTVSAELNFSNKASTSSCATEPSTANCDWQEIKIYSGEGDATNLPPNGFHLKIYADDKEAPTFVALEGKYRYTAATAAKFQASATCPGSEVAKIRTVYFQTVQKGPQIWGHFEFMDADDHPLSCDLPGGLDPFAKLAAPAGICQNLGSDQWVACSDVDYTNYVDLWQGETTFANVTATPVGDIWGGAPTEAGICKTDGCITFSGGGATH